MTRQGGGRKATPSAVPTTDAETTRPAVDEGEVRHVDHLALAQSRADHLVIAASAIAAGIFEPTARSSKHWFGWPWRWRSTGGRWHDGHPRRMDATTARDSRPGAPGGRTRWKWSGGVGIFSYLKKVSKGWQRSCAEAIDRRSALIAATEWAVPEPHPDFDADEVPPWDIPVEERRSPSSRPSLRWNRKECPGCGPAGSRCGNWRSLTATRRKVHVDDGHCCSDHNGEPDARRSLVRPRRACCGGGRLG